MTAAVATYLWEGTAVPSMNLAYSPSHIAEENAGRALSVDEHKAFLPALLVGSRAGYHGGVVVDAELGGRRRRREVLTALFAEVERSPSVLARPASPCCTSRRTRQSRTAKPGTGRLAHPGVR